MDLWDKVRAAVSEKFSNSGSCHDFDHTLRVLRNSELLLEKIPEADPSIVRFAALLHDIARPEEDSSKGKLCHAEVGAGMAFELLCRCGAEKDFAAAVSAAVRTHRFRDGNAPETIEAGIVYDADKLDSLGAVGVGRAFLFAGHFNARLHNRESEALAGSSYGREDTAYREYLVKLRYIPEKMFTAYGRELAAARAAFMQNFFEQLDAEIFF